MKKSSIVKFAVAGSILAIGLSAIVIASRCLEEVDYEEFDEEDE